METLKSPGVGKSESPEERKIKVNVQYKQVFYCNADLELTEDEFYVLASETEISENGPTLLFFQKIEAAFSQTTIISSDSVMDLLNVEEVTNDD